VDVREYIQYDAVGLAELIRDGQVSAAEVQRTACESIMQVNPRLNALVGRLFDPPLAYDPNGPFAGIPFGVKDLSLHAEGVPTCLGSRITGTGVSYPQDTDLMKRFRAGGLAALGRTTTPEFGFNASTEPVAHGPTRNPWDRSRSCGGSSGGSAALVASRALTVAHATDGGGSIRIPSAWCGLVGLKPTRGRTPVGPDVGEALNGLGIQFVVTRTVRDAAAVLDAVHGGAVGDKYITTPPIRPYADEVRTAPRPLRIAVMTGAWSGVPIEPQHVDAAQRVAAELTAAGHAVEEATPPVDWDDLMEAQLPIWCGQMALTVSLLAEKSGASPGPETLEAVSLASIEAGRRLTAADLYAGLRTCNQISRAVSEWFLAYDVLLTPTTAQLPPPLGYLNQNDPSLDPRSWLDRICALCPFTAVFNVTGHPAMSLPLAQSAEGLPIGIQIVGRYGDEATLFQVASYLEQALPWIDRVPAVLAGAPP
jgi:amidase